LGKNFGLEEISGFIFGVGEVFKDVVGEKGDGKKGGQTNKDQAESENMAV
jgi:hypothetical protein